MTKRKDWQDFWNNNNIHTVNIAPFVANFSYILEALNMHYCFNETNLEFNGLKTLEVGCGRGILSDLLDSCGCESHKVDKYFTAWDKQYFQKADVFDMPFQKAQFDMCFTYGLLEHFDFKDQIDILCKIQRVTKPGGLNLHYVVPDKITNFFESTIYRHACAELRGTFPHQWVYPVTFPWVTWFNWKTGRWMGKGFWLALERGYEPMKSHEGYLDNIIQVS